MYKCVNCGKNVDFRLETAKKIICNCCGHRVIEKERPKTITKVLAR